MRAAAGTPLLRMSPGGPRARVSDHPVGHMRGKDRFVVSAEEREEGGGGGERREQVCLGGVSLIFLVCTDEERSGERTVHLRLHGNVTAVEALRFSAASRSFSRSLP